MYYISWLQNWQTYSQKEAIGGQMLEEMPQWIQSKLLNETRLLIARQPKNTKIVQITKSKNKIAGITELQCLENFRQTPTMASAAP
jgi:hypothetical protein